MDIRNELRLEDRLDIQFGSMQYRCKVVRIKSAANFVVVHLGGGVIPEAYQPGSVATVLGYSQAGRSEFEGKLVQRDFKVQNIPAMEFEAVSHARKVQRRDSFRLPIHFPLKYMALSKEGVTKGTKAWKSAMAANLGDGGILITAAEGYAVGSELQCRFSLEGSYILIHGIVRRSDFEVTPEGALEFLMGLEFTSGNQEAKRQIAKFVMQCQINTRKREIK